MTRESIRDMVVRIDEKVHGIKKDVKTINRRLEQINGNMEKIQFQSHDNTEWIKTHCDYHKEHRSKLWAVMLTTWSAICGAIAVAYVKFKNLGG